MTCVDEFVWYRKLKRLFGNLCKVKLIIEPTDKNEPMRTNFEYFFSTYFGSSVPISKWIFGSPISINSISLPELVSQIHSNNSRIMFVSFRKMLSTLKVHVFRILPGPPKSIPIIVRAAPLRLACVVVQYYHETMLGQGFNCMVK